MKKYLYSAFIALFAISCSESEDPLQEIDPVIPSNAPQSLYAEIPRAESRAIWNTEFVNWDESSSINSRTYAVIDPKDTTEYYQYWHEGDAISLFLPLKKKTEHYKYVLQSGKDGDLGKFECDENIESEVISQTLNNYTYSIYPYKEATTMTSDGQFTFYFPKMQEYAGNSYAKGYNGMIAKELIEGSDDLYEFKNFCSYLQLRLTSDISKEVDRIILKATNVHDLMSGEGTITYDGNDEPVVTMNHEFATHEVTLDCRNHDVTLDPITPTNFWFVLPGNFTFTSGFKITVVFKDGTSFVKEKTYKNNEEPIHIRRNHITPMKPLKVVDVDTKPSVIRYKYEKPYCDSIDNKFQFPFPAGSFTDAAGNPLTMEQKYDSITKEWVITFNGVLKTIKSNSLIGKLGPDIDYITIQNSQSIDFEAHSLWECTADSITILNDISTIQFETFGHSNINNITIKGDVHQIDRKALALTNNSFDINIDGHIHTISDNAFDASKIHSLNITKDILNIGKEAFYNCSYLQSIDLSHVEIIGNSAFKSCNSLTTVTIGENCKIIEEGAFTTCDSLSSIYIYAQEPPTIIHKNGAYKNPYVFPDLETTNIYVLNVAKYNGADSWWWYSDKNTSPGVPVAKLTAMPTP